MTTRIFADIVKLSPDQSLRFEALSPDNGNRMSRNGVRLKSRKTEAFQKSFRYRLYDVRKEAVLWERWQEKDENPPASAYLSDDGEVVIHTTGSKRDLMMFIRRTGEVGLVVIVSSSVEREQKWMLIGTEYEEQMITRLRAENPRMNVASWRDEQVHLTTAGPFWMYSALETFPASPVGHFFAIRTAWGRRLLVNLDTRTLLDESTVSEDISTVVKNAERARALEILSRAPSLKSPKDFFEEVHGAIALVIEQRVAAAIPDLRILERGSTKGTATQCVALGGEWYCQWSTSRTLARYALRVLGEEPEATGNYIFTDGLAYDDESVEKERPFDGIASIAPAQAYTMAKALTEGVTVDWVLTNIGAPDYMKRGTRDVEGGHVWVELWEYDGAQGSIQIVWSWPETREPWRKAPPRHVAKVEEVEGWRHPHRLRSMLCLFC